MFHYKAQFVQEETKIIPEYTKLIKKTYLNF